MAPTVRWIELQAEIQFDVAKVSHTGSACDVDKLGGRGHLDLLELLLECPMLFHSD